MWGSLHSCALRVSGSNLFFPWNAVVVGRIDSPDVMKRCEKTAFNPNIWSGLKGTMVIEEA